jgi:hypothetical protein
MLYSSTKLSWTLAIGLFLSACDLTQLTKSSSTDAVAQPKTEATVIGIWRANIPVSATPPTDIKVTMDIGSDHTTLLSYRVATGKPSPYDYLEIKKEYSTWTVADGNLSSVKTHCEYKDQTTGLATAEVDCRAPIEESHDINVKGGAWTLIKEGAPLVFNKR